MYVHDHVEVKIKARGKKYLESVLRFVHRYTVHMHEYSNQVQFSTCLVRSSLGKSSITSNASIVTLTKFTISTNICRQGEEG